MKDSDFKRILDYIRPSFRSLKFCAVFCLVIGFLMLIFGGAYGVQLALITMLASAAVLTLPAWMEWGPYFRARSTLRSLRDDPAMHQAVLKDFDTAPTAFEGDVRVGSLYLFGRGSGAMIQRELGSSVVCYKQFYKGGWCWRVAVRNGDRMAQMLLDLDRDKYSQDFIKSGVERANELLSI